MADPHSSTPPTPPTQSLLLPPHGAGPAAAAPAWSASLLRAHLLAAHVALLAALAWLLLGPAALAGGPFHPRLLAAAHLVTLGCIATAAIGSWHAVLPLALRVQPRAGWFDWTLLVVLQLVAFGVASHMALGTYSGVAWSGGLLLVMLAVHVWRQIEPLTRANGPLALRAGVGVAFVNLLLAVVFGTVLAVDRSEPVLAAGHVAGLLAHAHLALGGFAGTLVAAVGLRLLPMFLPAAPLPAWFAWVPVAALGAGGPVYATAAVAGTPAELAGGWLLAAGAAAWLAAFVAFVARRRPRPPDVIAAAPSRVIVLTAVVSFAGALALGVLLLAGSLDDGRWRTAYGTLLLAGFAGLILGIGQRLAPLAARLHGATGSAHRMPSQRLAWTTAALWPAGIAATVAGIAATNVAALAAGTCAATLAVLADFANVLRVPARGPRVG